MSRVSHVTSWFPNSRLFDVFPSRCVRVTVLTGTAHCTAGQAHFGSLFITGTKGLEDLRWLVSDPSLLDLY